MQLKRLDWPEFGVGEPVSPWMPAGTYERRLLDLQSWLAAKGQTHLVVYGDREHFANLLWAAGLDPRFEEALLVLSRQGPGDLIVGNECAGYAPASPAVQSGLVNVRVCPDLSLPDQPPASALTLDDVIRDAGIDAHSKVAVAGWKPARTGIAAPGFLLDSLRFAAGWENVSDASAELIARRAICEPEEIAYFEWTNSLASEGMRRVIHAIEPGALDFDLLRQAAYPGVPLGCHMTLKCGENLHSLASARGAKVVRAGRFSCGICYWGANVCRAGWVVESAGELPVEARDYLDGFVFPFFDAMAAWFENLHVGADGAQIHNSFVSRFGPVKLNAGHLIHYDEWLSSPVYEQSQTRLQSGNVMQSDVIPSHPIYYSTRMEDGYALADPALQSALEERFPALFARCKARREFMRSALGLPLHDDVLPLSNTAGIVPPFLLAPEFVVSRA